MILSGDAMRNGRHTIFQCSGILGLLISALLIFGSGPAFGDPFSPSQKSAGGAQASALIHPPFFNGEVDLGSGIFWLTFSDSVAFGSYSYNFFPWLYHFDLGFEYFFDANNAAQGAYLWDAILGQFFYTDPDIFPFLYNFGTASWFFYFPDTIRPGHYTTTPRAFWDFGGNRVVYSPPTLVPVLDEPHAAPPFFGPGIGFVLNNPSVVASTIVMYNARGGARIPATLGTDYEIQVNGQQTEIVILPATVVIQPGDPLLVSYSYSTAPAAGISATR